MQIHLLIGSSTLPFISNQWPKPPCNRAWVSKGVHSLILSIQSLSVSLFVGLPPSFPECLFLPESCDESCQQYNLASYNAICLSIGPPDAKRASEALQTLFNSNTFIIKSELKRIFISEVITMNFHQMVADLQILHSFLVVLLNFWKIESINMDTFRAPSKTEKYYNNNKHFKKYSHHGNKVKLFLSVVGSGTRVT